MTHFGGTAIYRGLLFIPLGVQYMYYKYILSAYFMAFFPTKKHVKISRGLTQYGHRVSLKI